MRSICVRSTIKHPPTHADTDTATGADADADADTDASEEAGADADADASGEGGVEEEELVDNDGDVEVDGPVAALGGFPPFFFVMAWCVGVLEVRWAVFWACSASCLSLYNALGGGSRQNARHTKKR